MSKILIIRFSSFGDIVQSLSTLPLFKEQNSENELHFLVRSEFEELLSVNPMVDKVWKFDRSAGFFGLIKIIKELKGQKFKIIYDSHRSLRTFFIRMFLLGIGPALFPDLFVSPKFLTRPKERIKRFLLFYFRINLFPERYKGMLSYMMPLKILGVEAKLVPQKWNFEESLEIKLKSMLDDDYRDFEKLICLAPSAAWEMKRWPLNHFKKLIEILPGYKFIILGGPQDIFCQELKRVAPRRVYDFSGKLSLLESCFTISKCAILISADTGVLHVADLLGKNAIALIGPTAFGHTTGSWVKEMSVELSCRPCTKDGRGKCSQKVYQQCMVDIAPKSVADNIIKYLG